MTKKIIQVFKPNGGWREYPPGFGDFVRGTCNLHEHLKQHDINLFVDISHSSLSNYIIEDTSLFCENPKEQVVDAQEFFKSKEWPSLFKKIEDFIDSDEETLFLSTNVGEWSQLSLSDTTKDMAKKFFRFKHSVISPFNQLPTQEKYEVISIRCGDIYLSKTDSIDSKDNYKKIHRLLQTKIIPKLSQNAFIIGDCHRVTTNLAQSFGLIQTGLPPEHIGKSSEQLLPTMLDLCLLSHSKHNYHINIAHAWRSGFSHWASLVHSIPSTNFIKPAFYEERLDGHGGLKKVWDCRSRLLNLRHQLRRARKRLR